jgi:MOSC domain-containing protein YiiM
LEASHVRTDTSDESAAIVVSVNVGVVREVVFHGEVRTTGIWKEPVPGPVFVRSLGATGDHQADPVNHGGINKAVYAYAAEDAQWWQEQLGIPIPPGTFGENLTIVGVPMNEARIGERWRVGGAVLQVTQPRFPCWKLGLRMNDSRFTKRFLDAGRAGAYLSVVQEGDVEAGDRVERISAPGHCLTVGLVAYLNHADRPLALRLLEAAEQGRDPEQLDELLLRSASGVG